VYNNCLMNIQGLFYSADVISVIFEQEMEKDLGIIRGYDWIKTKSFQPFVIKDYSDHAMYIYKYHQGTFAEQFMMDLGCRYAKYSKKNREIIEKYLSKFPCNINKKDVDYCQSFNKKPDFYVQMKMVDKDKILATYDREDIHERVIIELPPPNFEENLRDEFGEPHLTTFYNEDLRDCCYSFWLFHGKNYYSTNWEYGKNYTIIVMDKFVISEYPPPMDDKEFIYQSSEIQDTFS